MFARRSMPLIFVILIQSLAIGCYSSKLILPRTVPVSGAVVCNGRAVSGARVQFHPQFDIGKLEFIPYGETGADGKFVLSTGASGNGAPQGEYIVTMELPIIGTDPKDGLEAEIDLLKGAYSNPARSKWIVNLKAGENILDPFQIKMP